MSQLAPGVWWQSRCSWLTEQIPGKRHEGLECQFTSSLLSKAAFLLSGVGKEQVLWLYFSAKLCHLFSASLLYGNIAFNCFARTQKLNFLQLIDICKNCG